MGLARTTQAKPALLTTCFACFSHILVPHSLFTLTFGAAPLILAPMSEVWGRMWIYIASAILFTIFQIPQALAPNIQTMLVARFISGIGGSSAIALGELFPAQILENHTEIDVCLQSGARFQIYTITITEGYRCFALASLPLRPQVRAMPLRCYEQDRGDQLRGGGPSDAVGRSPLTLRSPGGL